MYTKLKSEGIAPKELVDSKIPDETRRKEAAYVVIECFQEIPCDPCVKACPKGAISIKDNINNKPQVDLTKCDGCGVCIALCPGLAIFVADETKEEYAILKIPHEFNPPEKGTVVEALDREGNKVADVKVNRVVKTKSKTNVVWLEVPHEFVNIIRAIKP